MILVEMVHDARIVRLADKHVASNVRKWMGDSIGHWEGDTLVVETTNFTDYESFRGATRDARVIERSRALRRTRSTIDSRSRIRRRSRDPSAASCLSIARTIRSTNTPAMKATTRCEAFSLVRASRRKRPQVARDPGREPALAAAPSSSRGATMNIQEMMRTHPRAGRTLSNPLVECIERCFSCAQTLPGVRGGMRTSRPAGQLDAARSATECRCRRLDWRYMPVARLYVPRPIFDARL